MYTECVCQHDNAKDKYRVHCAVFEEFVFFDAFNIANSELSYNNSTNAISYENEWYGKGKRKRTEDSIDGEACINDFQIEDFAPVA